MRRLSNLLLLFISLPLCAQEVPNTGSFDLYGHVMLDMGFNTGAINPDWSDVLRTTQLPAFDGQYGPEGNFYAGVRQTRFGVKGTTPTALGELFTQFEWELFGVGADAGQTTFRLRHAYGQLGKWGAGQYWSPFMDIDIFPNSIEYWGPSGMALYRNIQLRYMPIQGDDHLTIALERPGASGDQGIYAEIIEQENISLRFPTPDVSAEYRKSTGFGYVELAGILRNIGWEDQLEDSLDLTGRAIGWGLNLTSNIRLGKKSTVRAGVVYGAGVQNYMNDATTDIAVRVRENDARTPLEGYATPMHAFSLFLDHAWSDKLSSALGYSRMEFDLDPTSDPSNFKSGQYALVNVLHSPAPGFLWGGEVQYGSRENFKDGWEYSTIKIQFSFKYTFGATIQTRPKA